MNRRSRRGSSAREYQTQLRHTIGSIRPAHRARVRLFSTNFKHCAPFSGVGFEGSTALVLFCLTFDR